MADSTLAIISVAGRYARVKEKFSPFFGRAISVSSRDLEDKLVTQFVLSIYGISIGDMAACFFAETSLCRFMDREAGEVYKLTKKERGEHFPIRSDQVSSISSLDQYYFLSDPWSSILLPSCVILCCRVGLPFHLFLIAALAVSHSSLLG